MALLAGYSFIKNLTVIILCVAAVIFLIVDAFLVMSLHKHNKRLARKEKTVSSETCDNPENKQ